jgi:hypothetical protein
MSKNEVTKKIKQSFAKVRNSVKRAAKEVVKEYGEADAFRAEEAEKMSPRQAYDAALAEQIALHGGNNKYM